MNDYWKRIQNKLAEFATPTDALVCVAVRDGPQTSCELCGHTPIRWRHILLNVRTQGRLRLGSECIVNYKQVKAALGLKNPIYYPTPLASVVAYLNQRGAGSVTVSAQYDSLLEDVPRPRHDLEPPTRTEPPRVYQDEWDEAHGLYVQYVRDANGDIVDVELDEDESPEGLGLDEIDWESERKD